MAAAWWLGTEEAVPIFRGLFRRWEKGRQKKGTAYSVHSSRIGQQTAAWWLGTEKAVPIFRAFFKDGG